MRASVRAGWQSLLERDRLSWILPWLAPLLATLLSWLLQPVLPNNNLSLIYLAGVLLTAVTTRVRPALACAVLSFLAYNFFHTEPQYTLLMIHREDILTVLLLLLVAVVTGHLAASRNEKVLALQASQRWHAHQMELSRHLAQCVDGPQVLQTLTDQLARDVRRPTYTLVRGVHPGEYQVLQSVPAEIEPVLRQAWQESGSGDDIDIRQGSDGQCLYFYQQAECFGLILLVDTDRLPAAQQQQLTAFVQLTRLAWGRIQLASRLQQETLMKEREQLRSALLSSISHDLRTPLATMIGSVSSLIELETALSAEQKRELLQNTLSEARRLDGYIQKLLDMTKLGHGELKLDRDWIGVDDIISVVIKRTRPLLRSVRLRLEVPPELPLLHVHPTLIEQALFNVVENALRYAPPESEVLIAVALDNAHMHIDVRDQGPGIPETAWPEVFDMFFSLSHGDQYPSGTGLGLAICQGILGAHGGEATVLRSRPGETVIRLSLPLPETPATVLEPR